MVTLIDSPVRAEFRAIRRHLTIETFVGTICKLLKLVKRYGFTVLC